MRGEKNRQISHLPVSAQSACVLLTQRKRMRGCDSALFPVIRRSTQAAVWQHTCDWGGGEGYINFLVNTPVSIPAFRTQKSQPAIGPARTVCAWCFGLAVMDGTSGCDKRVLQSMQQRTGEENPYFPLAGNSPGTSTKPALHRFVATSQADRVDHILRQTSPPQADRSSSHELLSSCPLQEHRRTCRHVSLSL